ncbi:unnamed protein product [Ectocarpus sp. CCAP 1310/34]|nr:unnamed protein product [Ectocarpus sp. CCAP 1310/34]
MERYPQDPRAKAFRPSLRFAQMWATRHKNKSVEERLPNVSLLGSGLTCSRR